MDPAQQARRAENTVRNAEQSGPLNVLITVGLIVYGVVHLLVAWISVQVAWGGKNSGQEASQKGALSTMAETGFGSVLLWITAAGMAALVIWQAGEAIWGYQDKEKAKRIRKRLGSAGRVVVYATIGYSAARQAITGGAESSGDQKEESLTGKLLSVAFGRILVIVVGLVVIGFGPG